MSILQQSVFSFFIANLHS